MYFNKSPSHTYHPSQSDLFHFSLPCANELTLRAQPYSQVLKHKKEVYYFKTTTNYLTKKLFINNISLIDIKCLMHDIRFNKINICIWQKFMNNLSIIHILYASILLMITSQYSLKISTIEINREPKNLLFNFCKYQWQFFCLLHTSI